MRGYPSQWQQADDEDFKEEQNLMARLVHMLKNDDLELMFQVTSLHAYRFLQFFFLLCG